MNLVKRILAVALVMVFALALTACGKKGDDITGTWILTGGAMIDMMAAELPEGMTMADMGVEISFTFEKDDKFAMNMTAFGETETENGTYKIEDGKLTMTVEDDPVTCEYKLDGDTLTLLNVEEFEGDMVFTKKK